VRNQLPHQVCNPQWSHLFSVLTQRMNVVKEKAPHLFIFLLVVSFRSFPFAECAVFVSWYHIIIPEHKFMDTGNYYVH